MSHIHFRFEMHPADKPAEAKPARVTIHTSQEGMQALLNRLMQDEEVAQGLANHNIESLDHLFVYLAKPPLHRKQSLLSMIGQGAVLAGCILPMLTFVAAIAVCMIVGGCVLGAWCCQLVGLMIRL